jgi:UDP-3-O-[3-hydroxymyristoyl] glucosamine N-acyltransferase
MPVTLGELAVRFGCPLRGDPDTIVQRVATLQNAGADALTFFVNPKLRRYLANSQAGAVVLAPQFVDECPVASLQAKNPYATYARMAAVLHPLPPPTPGVHAGASVHQDAQVDPTAAIGARAVIEAGASIGAGAVVGPGCVVMRGARIGAHSRLVANVTVCADGKIGERCLLHPGVVIGGDGFGFAPDAGSWVKIPQLGSVVIGNDVDIGCNTTIDRGTIEDTLIEDGVKLDNQIQIGHNVKIGAHTIIAACVGIAGSTTLGKRCMIAGAVGITGHIEICDDVVVTGHSTVTHSIRQPGTYSSALPLDDARKYRRNAARFRHLDELAKKIGGRHTAPAGDPDYNEEEQ